MNDRTLRRHIEAAETLKNEIERLKKEYEAHKSIIKNEMEARNADTYAAARFPYIVTYKHYKVSRFDSTAFKADNPQAYAMYTKETEQTRLDIKQAI